VRLAANLAIDRQAVNQAEILGLSKVAASIIRRLLKTRQALTSTREIRSGVAPGRLPGRGAAASRLPARACPPIGGTLGHRMPRLETFRDGGAQMKSRILAAAAALLLVSILGYPGTASAWAFYWSKVEVQTSSWKGCMNIAFGIVQKRNLTQAKRTDLAVTGSRTGASATITCIGTGRNSKAMAVVMVVGDADGPVKQLRDDLADAVHRERIID
jgi:hypothetical protein